MAQPLRSGFLTPVLLLFAMAAGGAIVSGLAAELSSIGAAVIEQPAYPER